MPRTLLGLTLSLLPLVGLQAQELSPSPTPPPTDLNTAAEPELAPPLLLQDAMSLALLNNPALKAAQSQVEVQQALVRAGWGAFLPQIAATASWGIRDADDPAAGRPYTSTHPSSQGIILNQPLSFAAEATQLRARRAQAEAARARAADSRQGTVLRVAETYSGLLVQQAAMASAASLIEALADAEAAAQLRFRTGESTRTDVAQATARRLEAEAALAEAQGRYEVQRQQLEALTGTAFPVSLTLAWPEIPTLARDQLTIETHPDLLAARATTRAARAEALNAATAALPEFSARAEAGRTEQAVSRAEGPVDARSLTFNVSMPLFTGGQTLAGWQAARAQARANAYTVADLELSLRAELVGALSTLDAAQLARAAAEANLLAQEDATGGVRLEYKVGTRSQTDLLDAEQELAASQLNLATARQNELLAVYRVLAAAGALSAPRQTTTSTATP